MTKKADEAAKAEQDDATPDADPIAVEDARLTVEEAIDNLPATVARGEAADVFRRMDLEDERQILDELQGRALDVMLYSFEIDGKPQTGLSWKGTREAVRTLNARGWTAIKMDPAVPPRFEDFIDEENEEAIRCIVYAVDERNGGGNWGMAVAPKKAKRRGGARVPDTFAAHKALSKAQRNAFEPLVPAEVVEYLKAQFLGRPDAVKVIPGAGKAIDTEAPPALTDERATEQLAQITALYDEIKAIDRIVMPPGQFNALVQRSQHDHDAMDRTIEHLKTFRDGEAEIAGLRERWRGMVEVNVYDKAVRKMAGLSQARRIAAFQGLIEKAEEAKS